MDTPTILVLAVGLAMDCFAVAFSEGLHRHQSPLQVLSMAVVFGLFQGGMPLISYFLGSYLSDLICRFAPWIALVLLLAVGGQMLWNAYRHQSNHTESINLGRWAVGKVLVLAVATSIDALSVGVLLVPYPNSLIKAVGVIGLTAAVFTIIGYALGGLLGKKLPFSPEWIAGSLLIAMGIKICLSAYL